MDKNNRELSRFQKVRHGLAFKAFIMVVLLTFLIGVAVLLAGLYMFYQSALYETRLHTCTLAKGMVAVLDDDVVKSKTEEVLDIYESLPKDVTDNPKADGYKDYYKDVVDDTFKDLQQQMWDMQHELGLRNSFIVAMDSKTNRMIYLLDADLREKSFCYPGTWDQYKAEEVDVLINGEKTTKLQDRLGLKNDYQATITNSKEFGLRCTGGETLYERGDFSVILCLDETLDHLTLISRMFTRRFALLLLITIGIAALIAIMIIRRKVTVPLGKLAHAARGYYEDKKQGISAPNRFSQLEINTRDEIQELDLAMKDMESGLIEYEKHLKEVTAEQERINTELNLAKRIQMDMLPSIFPPFPERNDFDIYATMDPAKEVGGDFYDFFLIDDNHLGCMIADVSGKGVPAALFMMVSKTILDNVLKRGASPAQSLEYANNVICANNKEEMFVTVWLAVLELSTGLVTASNAGHECPVKIKADGTVELIKDKHGFVVGGMENMKYKDYEISLESGDKLFVYTDGVPEATDKDEELFGTERMLEALRKDPQANPQGILKNVRTAVDDFVGDAEQFDDLTMLCLQLKDRRG